jgi:hypothetical protein
MKSLLKTIEKLNFIDTRRKKIEKSMNRDKNLIRAARKKKRNIKKESK